MMLLKLNSRKGEILYNDLYLDEEIPLSKQLDNLKEDLLQVNFYNKYLIDIGWYPEFDKNGQFKISVIKEYDWDNPICISICKTIEDLKKKFEHCIQIIDKNTYNV